MVFRTHTVTLCFSVMQQCDTKSVFSASCPFFLTLHWSIHSDMSEAWCSAALFGFLSNTIRLEWRWRLRCLHIQSKICLILLHRPLQMRAFFFSEGRWFDAFINWQSCVIHAYSKSPTIWGWLSMAVVTDKKCVCVLSHLVIWQCWQTATQATDSYSSSLIKAPSLASKQTPTALLSSTHSCTHAVKNHEQGFLDKEKLTHTYESARYNQVNNCSAMIKTR